MCYTACRMSTCELFVKLLGEGVSLVSGRRRQVTWRKLRTSSRPLCWYLISHKSCRVASHKLSPEIPDLTQKCQTLRKALLNRQPIYIGEMFQAIVTSGQIVHSLHLSGIRLDHMGIDEGGLIRPEHCNPPILQDVAWQLAGGTC